MYPRPVKVLVAILLLSALVASQASAAKPTPVPHIESATLRDASDDVVLSDGAGPYFGKDFHETLFDLRPSRPDGQISTTGDQDYLYLEMNFGGARYTNFNNALASAEEYGEGSSQPIPCKSGRFLFVSPSTPDFFEVLETVGKSVKGFASVGCWTTDEFKYQANYEPIGPDECVTLTRSSETTLTMTAPPFSPTGPLSCFAVIYTFDSSTEPTDSNVLGHSSAPFEVTFAISTGPGNGKGGKGNH